MKISEYTHAITSELQNALAGVSNDEADALIKALQSAKRVFVAGAGRSRLMICGFAMRLMHLGLTAYVVGEIVTPALTPDDLLLIASGSGETGSLTVMAAKAKKIGAKLATITIFPESTIGKYADYVVRIPAPTSKNPGASDVRSIQPGASMFEQSVLLFGDAIILSMSAKNLSEQNAALMALHANLE